MAQRRDGHGRFAGGGGGGGGSKGSKGIKVSPGQRAKAEIARAGFGVRGTGTGAAKSASSKGMEKKIAQAKANGRQRAEALGSLKMSSYALRYRTAQTQRALPKGQGLSAERSNAAKALNKDRKALNEVRRQLKPKRFKPA